MTSLFSVTPLGAPDRVSDAVPFVAAVLLVRDFLLAVVDGFRAEVLLATVRVPHTSATSVYNQLDPTFGAVASWRIPENAHRPKGLVKLR